MQKIGRTKFTQLLAVCVLAGVCSFAAAQNKTTKILVAFPPGGPVDFVARTLTEQLGKELGHTVVVENKAGANGAIAADALMKAPADGQTLWLTSVGAVAINPALYPNLPYDPVRDLAPVSLVVNNVELLVVNPNTPTNQPQEFINMAKQKRITMASSGTGSVPHLAMELLADATKSNLIHVPYKGSGASLKDAVSGHIKIIFGNVLKLRELRSMVLIPAIWTMPSGLNLTTQVQSFQCILRMSQNSSFPTAF